MDRQRLGHRKIGQALETLYPERLDELSGELARHFEQAGALKRALEYAERAGSRAQPSYAFTKALQLAQKLGDRQLSKTGAIYHELGQYEEALRFHQEALKIAAQISDQSLQGGSLHNLGNAHYHLGRHEEAERCKGYRGLISAFGDDREIVEIF